MAAVDGAEDVRWSSVVGEYGVLLTEMGSMEELISPIKSYPRIKYTCMTASKKYVAMGSSTGGIYLFDRHTLKHSRFISNKDGPIHAICFTQQRNLLAATTSLGIVNVWQVSSRHREKPKLIRRSEEHKNTTVSALIWDSDEGHVFAGDMLGVVSVIHVPQSNKLSPGNKGRPLLHSTSSIVAKAHTAIVQLDCIGDKLLVSTLTKCAVVDLKSLNSVSVGVKPRDGLYGSCFYKESTSDSLTIYSARPGSRLWEASIDGQVLSTQQYKKLLGTPPVTVLGYRCNDLKALQQGDFPPQSVNFAKLLLVRERFIATWSGMRLYILDPILGQLVAWYSLDAEILDACCLGPEIYIYDLDGCVKWFGLLSVKECVARLNAMGEIKQCITVLLDCKQYIIPGSARDLVPVSLVRNLRDGLHEEENEDNKEIVLRLEALENDLEPALEENCYPPSFYGNIGGANSPDTLSVCSEAFTDDLEGTVSTSGTRVGEEEEGEEGVHEGHKGISGEYGLSNVIKKRNISFEGILISAAAAAKKFAIERQKGVLNTKTSVSPVSPRNERNVPGGVDGTTEKHDGANSVSDTGQQTKGVDIQVEESPILSKKSLEQSPCHSDDSESRLSGNEAGAYEEEACDKKELVVSKDKRKRKKRVVTVDIDTPQVEEGVFLESPNNQPRSSSFRYPSLSIEDTELKNRRLSEPVSPLPSELPPAIPAILSKAKGLLKKKLKSPVDDQLPSLFQSSSPTPPPLEESLVESAKENTARPLEVEELIQCSAKTRNEVKNPAVLFSINGLCKTLEEWIPKLHAATKSCFELNANWKESNRKIELKSFLNEDAFGNVSYLTQMCFDCGVYGLEGLKCVEEAQNVAENTSKLSPNLEIQDSKENANVEDPSECELDDVAFDAAPERIPNVSERGSTPSRIGVASIGGSSPIEVPSASENALTTKTDASTSRSTSSESEEKNQELNDTSEDGGELASAVPLSACDRDVVNQQNSVAESSASGSFPSNGEKPETATQAQSNTFRSQPVANCERICQHCANKRAFFKPTDEMEDHNENSTQEQVDSYRARFLSYYFFLFDVKRLRRTLHFIKGDKQKTWSILIDSLSGLISVDDVIAKHTEEGDARRALHELYDGMKAYSETLLYHLSCLYEHDGRETMLICARMFPDVKPWEVMKICRQSKVHSLESSAADFLYYTEQLMRWSAEVGNTKEQTVGKVCEDREVARWWFHCALIANSTAPTNEPDCQLCGMPRPGSHTVAWQNADHLRLLLAYICKKEPKELGKFMDMCWKHCYWSGLIPLCIRANRRKEALRLLMCLGDLCLIKDPQPWGLLPKTLNEWKLLLELLLSRDHQDDKCTHLCAQLASPDWSADLTWSNVTKLMLERLGAGHTVNLLQALALDTPHLSGDFYYSCLLGAVIERRQRTLIHEMLKKLDSYLWSRRSGALAPKINNFRKEEELLGSKCKDDVKPQLDSLSQFRTLEDGASNWGQNIRLSDGECLVCSLKLCEQISTNRQGLVMFECGHVFHKHCVPEAACVLCFQANLTSIGTSMKL